MKADKITKREMVRAVRDQARILYLSYRNPITKKVEVPAIKREIEALRAAARALLST